MANFATDNHTASTMSGDGSTDYERADKLFADRSRRTSNDVFESGMRITDFGHFKKKRTGPTTFEFNVLGQLIHYKPWWKARWLLRGSGIHVRQA